MTLAIIAGNGDMPKSIIKECEKQKKKFVLILIAGQGDPKDYKKYDHDVIKIGYVSQALKILKNNKVKDVIFIGGVKKPSFSNIKVDKKGAVLLSKIVANKMFGDNNILTTITKFFKKEGFNIVGVDHVIKDAVVKKGVLTKSKPSNADLEDIKLGQKYLDLNSKMDIGQSVVVQQKQIIAIEAMEGTDGLIKRTKDISFKKGSKPILVKLKKKGQSSKVDLPTIGVNTIENLAKSGFGGIAINAGCTLIVDKEKLVDLANKNKIFIAVI